LLAQILDLGKIIENDIRLIRMIGQVVLMVAFGFMKNLQCGDLSYEGTTEDFSLIELLDVSLRDAPLFFVKVKNSRAILRTSVRPLPI
jgi:hypothetical protein